LRDSSRRTLKFAMLASWWLQSSQVSTITFYVARKNGCAKMHSSIFQFAHAWIFLTSLSSFPSSYLLTRGGEPRHSPDGWEVVIPTLPARSWVRVLALAPSLYT
jgi:hypothetical protein